MVKIICDSACDLTPELLEKYHISIIPCHVLLREKDYLDGISIRPEDLFAFVEKEGVLPKTAAPSVEEITEVMNRELEAATEIVVLSMSSKISGTYNFMKLAAQETGKEERIRVIDSESLCTGFGVLAIEAASMAMEGLGADEIAASIENLKSRVEVSFVVDSLSYLEMGGRCTTVEALLGSSLRIHPLIHMDGGALHVKKKYMGSMDHCLQKYEKEVLRDLEGTDVDRIMLTASMPFDIPVMKKIYEDLESTGRFREIHRVTAGSLISSHCGPGAMAIMYLKKGDGHGGRTQTQSALRREVPEEI